MSFITPRDPDYLRAKRIKQGESRVDPVYDAFIERFRLEYGFSPLAVFVDTMRRPQGQGNMPRLGVVLERTNHSQRLGPAGDLGRHVLRNCQAL